MKSKEKIFYTFLIILSIFTLGVQVGIHHGRELQRVEDIRIQRMQEYIFKNMARCEAI
ncbi:MAG TPA: hypothetical protein P5556_09005 [Candidatus Gastranaerophilales bacterium]|nr:hypothetical protein [Candidatus Gastranaerophilales bacterium]